MKTFVTIIIEGRTGRRLDMAGRFWLLDLFWYTLRYFAVAGPMTFVGENEGGAGLRLLTFSLGGTIIINVIVRRLLVAGGESGVAR